MGVGLLFFICGSLFIGSTGFELLTEVMGYGYYIWRTQWSDFNDHGHLNDNFAIFGLLFIPRNSHLNYLAGSKGHF